MLNLHEVFASPVKIASLALLRYRDRYFVRSVSTDGVVGIANTNERARYLWPILKEFVMPYFIGKDARDLESLVDGVYTYRSAYKLAGIALWNCVAYVEFSLFDMLGMLAGRSVGELLGGVLRHEVPIYLSSLRRDTTPEEEVAWIGQRLAETHAMAVKIKIGGRMSKNADAFPGRSEALVSLARRTFGNAVTIYVDANGSYDSAYAIKVGRMLASYNVGFLEEPCPWQEYEETKRVADALDLPVAGGEQDSSLPQFDWMIRNRAVDIVQPDLVYNGGFIRCLRVARMAAAAGMQVTPHCPRSDANSAYMLHFVSVTPNAGPFHEYRGEARDPESWYTPKFNVENGVVPVPAGPGLGVAYDPDIWRDAEVLFTESI